jgi:uncharacterized protein
VPTTDDDRLVEPLDSSDCHALLGTVRIGRLAFTRDALPAIQPVTFRVHEDRVVIPARSCSGLLPGARGAVVAFEVDAFDDETRTGWTVTVVGPSRSVTDPTEVAALDGLAWPRPSTGPDRCYISVDIGLIHGLRAVPARAVPPDPVRGARGPDADLTGHPPHG